MELISGILMILGLMFIGLMIIYGIFSFGDWVERKAKIVAHDIVEDHVKRDTHGVGFGLSRFEIIDIVTDMLNDHENNKHRVKCRPKE